jgi:hypothetical protein
MKAFLNTTGHKASKLRGGSRLSRDFLYQSSGAVMFVSEDLSSYSRYVRAGGLGIGVRAPGRACGETVKSLMVTSLRLCMYGLDKIS